MIGYNNPTDPLTSTSLHSLEDVDGSDPFHEPHLFFNLPWFYSFHMLNLSMLAQYAKSGMIPSRVPLRALSFTEWDLQIVVPPREILPRPEKVLPSDHIDLARLLHKFLRRITEGLPLKIDLTLDTWAFRSHAEALYGQALSEIVFD